MQDLWPNNIGENTINSPVSIMREQAQLLGQKTKNLVEAEVSIGSPTSNKFVYYFYIVAPTLHDYHFRLFTVEHDIDIYPLTIYMDEALGEELGAGTPKTAASALHRQTNAAIASAGFAQSSIQYSITVSSEDEFIDTLRKVLNSRRSQQVIRSLLSQVNTDYTPIFM
ncbi:MAG: hypothetical protein KDE19_01120 [Caldilineaceae bacterium]|nr:hypothetical protein [Caldilineaceae bacterium]